MHHLLDQLNSRVHSLLIDSIESINDTSSIIATKQVSFSDPIFINLSSIKAATFPHQQLIDAHIQTGYLLLLNENHLNNHTFQLNRIKSFNYDTPIFPGSEIRIDTERVSDIDNQVSFKSSSYVNGIEHSTIAFSIQRSDSSTSSTFIHPTASVHPSAMLGENVHIGPYSIINEQVSIGDNTTISAHVMVEKWSTIGTGNNIHYGTVIGSPAQDIKYKGEESFVIIGDNNHIREYVTINRATGKDEATIIGSNNMLLTNTHIGHNCVLGNNITMANVVHVGGHVTIEDNATIGGLTGIHQFVRIGTGTMTGGYSRLIQDIPPFMLCDGNPAYVRNLNIIGCRRRGMSKASLADLKQLYKLLYRSQLNISQALEEFSPATQSDEVTTLINFLKHNSSRGISKKAQVEQSDDPSE